MQCLGATNDAHQRKKDRASCAARPSEGGWRYGVSALNAVTLGVIFDGWSAKRRIPVLRRHAPVAVPDGSLSSLQGGASPHHSLVAHQAAPDPRSHETRYSGADVGPEVGLSMVL